MPTPDGAAPRRKPRYRRRLRTRIILSFVLLGFGLTVLFAYAAILARQRVENALVEDVMNRNLDESWHRFERSGGRAPEAPVEQMRAYFYTPDKFERVREIKPEWYAMKDGIHNITDIGPGGGPHSFKLGVRKTPQAWFFIAYDMEQTARAELQFKRAVYGSIAVFTLFSLLVGWWRLRGS